MNTNTNRLETLITTVIDEYKKAAGLLKSSFNSKNKPANTTNQTKNINDEILEKLGNILRMITDIDKLFTQIINSDKYKEVQKLSNTNLQNYPVNNMIMYIKNLDEQIQLKNSERKGYLGKIRKALTEINKIGERLGVSPNTNLTNVRNFIKNNPSNNTPRVNNTPGASNGNLQSLINKINTLNKNSILSLKTKLSNSNRNNKNKLITIVNNRIRTLNNTTQ